MDSHRHSPDSQNDSDDWTLVSPQPSPSSSPERQEFLPNNSRSTQTNHSSSDSSLEHIIDDGLTEVELNDNCGDRRQQTLETNTTNASAYQACEGTGVSSSTESIPGFQAINTTTDEELSESSSRRSSLTQSQLNEYVDFGRKSEDNDTITVTSQTNNLDTSVVACVDEATETSSQREQQTTTSSPPHQQQLLLDEQLNRPDLDRQPNDVIRNNNRRLRENFDCVVVIFIWTIVFLLAHFYKNFISDDIRDAKLLRNRHLDKALNNYRWANGIPSSQIIELQSLTNELSQCIKRQSPSSFKYYMSEERLKKLDVRSSDDPKNDGFEPSKSYRNLFCYGQEMKWRNKFDRLKSEHNLDLPRMVEQAKKHVTTEMLGSLHPSLDFRLILNQLEYLDFLEERRNKKQSEETIKYLQAENLQLLHRLNQPNETGYQKLVVGLEMKNSKLQRENEALKAKLLEKAGPVYIKQSLELERVESENVLLKQFLQQIGKDVSKSLRQFNLHTVDTSTILDDHKSLNAQLMLTKGYMRRLSEKISTVLIENEGLKEELRELYSSLSTATDNLLATHNDELSNQAIDARDKNDSNALMADSCMRSLYELREKSAHLETENAKLRRECHMSSGVEKSSGRNLNRTNEGNQLFSIEEQSISKSRRRIGSIDTAVDKRIKDILSMRNDDTFLDELMVFLTKFNNHVESNELTRVRYLQEGNQDSSEILVDMENSKQHSGNKIIPNYIREAIRNGRMNGEIQQAIQMNGNSKDDGQLKLPRPQPLPTASKSHQDRSNISLPLDCEGKPVRGFILKNCDDYDMKRMRYTNRSQQHSETQNDTAELSSSIESSILASTDSSTTDETNKYLYTATSENVARDTWFFKRAKQRRQLRHSDFEVNSKTTDWVIKRAKLREKLRKASSYIEYHYMPREYVFGSSGKPSHNRRQASNKRENNDKKHKKRHQKQRNYNKYYRDEL